jgi:hypothetical protein
MHDVLNAFIMSFSGMVFTSKCNFLYIYMYIILEGRVQNLFI